ncbi:MotE family protein [Bacillus solimangrovi]|uniref:Magnesium transporter MgtE intracellular domain-containing protein n=1 Tax=Bacillus solimangrovi TaxID=1305675 RepID=A0A1E5LB25_9BACI|nr:hypothetical protein [Bacillus solimangrovi]OEH91263.1 hypothetical protein BFG57_06495 [Bacillus solimangrovi]
MEQIEKKHSKLQWFFFVIVFPLLTAITIVLIVLIMLGVNVFDLKNEVVNKVPVLSAVFDSEGVSPEEDPFLLRADLQNKEAQLANLNKLIEQKDQQIEQFQVEIDQLNEQIQAEAISEEKRQADIKSLAKTYSEMDEKPAAAIIEQLEDYEAAEIMLEMKDDERAEVFNVMDPSKAAIITQIIKDGLFVSN